MTAKVHTFNIKTSINPLVPCKFCPENKIYDPSDMKFGTKNTSNTLIINIYIIYSKLKILELKLKIWADLFSKS